MSKARSDELTLADLALRESLRRDAPDARARHRAAVAPEIRGVLSSARRFVLDKEASAFLSDLSHANFSGSTRRKATIAIENTRILARLPHAQTWIEYDARAERARTIAAYGKHTISLETLEPLDTADKVCPRIGWLLQQHPTLEEVFRASIFLDLGRDGRVLMAPWDYAWSTNDATLIPWGRIAVAPYGVAQSAASFALGFPGYDTPTVTMIPNHRTTKYDESTLRNLMIEEGGELRRILTLLAAINDVPIGVKHVTQTKGFVARGRYRKYLSHAVISIVLPKGRDPQKVARQVIALARRRAHQVRGHWRRDWRHEGNRIWISEHQRGDASLGFVTHDYRVEHQNEQEHVA
jgi:hypothetical protein